MPSQLPDSVPARYLNLCLVSIGWFPALEARKIRGADLNWANSWTSPANPGIPPNLEWPGTEPTASAVTSMSMVTESMQEQRLLCFLSVGLDTYEKTPEDFHPNSAWPLRPARSTSPLLRLHLLLFSSLLQPHWSVVSPPSIIVLSTLEPLHLLFIPSSEMLLP